MSKYRNMLMKKRRHVGLHRGFVQLHTIQILSFFNASHFIGPLDKMVTTILKTTILANILFLN